MQELGPCGLHPKACFEIHEVEEEIVEYVTRDMSIDAGAPEMEGMPQHGRIRRQVEGCSTCSRERRVKLATIEFCADLAASNNHHAAATDIRAINPDEIEVK